jgi:hypothetical protein
MGGKMNPDRINWRTALYVVAALIVIIGMFVLKNYQSMILNILVIFGLMGTDNHARKKQ